MCVCVCVCVCVCMCERHLSFHISIPGPRELVTSKRFFCFVFCLFVGKVECHWFIYQNRQMNPEYQKD